MDDENTIVRERRVSNGNDTEVVVEVEPPPDGGFIAWLQVFVVHLILFNSWGYMNSYGIFQSYYRDTHGWSQSQVSWIGSLQMFFVFFIGMFSGRLCDAGHMRRLFAVGLALEILGIFMTSLCTEVWELVLAHGVCVGIGSGLIYCPGVALVASYFQKWRAVASAAQACGSATGGMVFPAIAWKLIPRIGFRWSVRVMGFVVLFNGLIIMLCAKPRMPPRREKIIDRTSFRDVPYIMFAFGLFFTMWGQFIATYYARSYALQVAGCSDEESFALLLVLNGVGVIGRMMPAFVAVYLGPLNVLTPVIFFMAIIFFCWITVRGMPSMWAFVIFFGIMFHGTMALFPPAVVSMTPDLKKVGERLGMVMGFVSFAALTGTPIAGSLIDLSSNTYTRAQIFGGVVILTGAILILAADLKKHGFTIIHK